MGGLTQTERLRDEGTKRKCEVAKKRWGERETERLRDGETERRRESVKLRKRGEAADNLWQLPDNRLTA